MAYIFLLNNLKMVYQMFEDLDSFNNSTGFDGSVDFDYNENTGELSALFDVTDLDQYIDNLNGWDWYLWMN